MATHCKCLTFNYLTQLMFLYEEIGKGLLSWYRKLTWKSAHAWNLIILCTLIALGMTTINMVHLIFYAIPLSIYDVMHDITTRSKGTLL